MPAYIYTKMVEEASKTGVSLAQFTNRARSWLTQKYAQIGKETVRPVRFIEQVDRKKRRIRIGRLYMFLYDPKGKKELPYYDRFPLVFPVDFETDGFYGLNMHYLPPVLRAKLYDSLLELKTKSENENISAVELTRIRITYTLLKKAARFRFFKPCFKHYLYKQVRSPFIIVPEEEWNITMFLPSEQFKKATKEQVWKDSRSKV
jgi:hypothetical protein